jgi:CubicO group peptidase (beta-lactamase class C family)
MAQNYFSPAPGQFVRAEIKSLVGEAPPAYTSGGQGLVSSADDYLAFARMLLQGGVLNGVQVLRPQSAKLMTTNRLTREQRQRPSTGIALGRGEGFGLGVSVVTEPAMYRGWGGRGSFGWGGAFGGWWQADPEQQMLMLWLQECLPAPPVPGRPLAARVPGSQGTAEFQERTYEALRSNHGAAS